MGFLGKKAASPSHLWLPKFNSYSHTIFVGGELDCSPWQKDAGISTLRPLDVVIRRSMAFIIPQNDNTNTASWSRDICVYPLSWPETPPSSPYHFASHSLRTVQAAACAHRPCRRFEMPCTPRDFSTLPTRHLVQGSGVSLPNLVRPTRRLLTTLSCFHRSAAPPPKIINYTLIIRFIADLSVISMP